MTVMKASDLLKAADIHANRPAANAVPTGALYSCTTHNLIYRSDGSSWSTWATLSGGSVAANGVSFTPTGGLSSTDVQAALAELDTEKQPLDTDLTALAALVSAADKMPYATGAGTWSLADLTAFARTLLDDANASAARTTLGLGTAATLNVPASGNAASGEVVKGDDTRLGGGSSILLAQQRYNPDPQVQTTLGTSEADVDATNLAVTFTAPASGAVDIDVTILVIGNPGNSIYLTLRNGASTVAGTRGRALTLANLTSLSAQIKVTHSVRVTGLTAGTSYTYKLGAFYSGGSTAAQLGYGDTTAGSAPLGPALFKVWSA